MVALRGDHRNDQGEFAGLPQPEAGLAREVACLAWVHDRHRLAGGVGGPPRRAPQLACCCVSSRGGPGLSVYAATKAGLEGFAKSLAREVGPRGIRVNAIAPGFLETDLSASLSAENRSRIARRTPLGRLGLPADIVGAIEFLASPRAAFITGQVLTIDGGSSA
ncbi:MAG: SDR family oxidoreductase [Planctomycetota bacterium]